jgi:hypothetical protein
MRLTPDVYKIKPCIFVTDSWQRQARVFAAEKYF